MRQKIARKTKFSRWLVTQVTVATFQAAYGRNGTRAATYWRASKPVPKRCPLLKNGRKP